MTVRHHEVVAALGQTLCQRIGEPRYQLWFADKTRFTWTDSGLNVGVPNHFFREWLAKTFTEDIVAAARSVLGQVVSVRFAIDPELFQEARRREQATPPKEPRAPIAAPTTTTSARSVEDNKTWPRRYLRLDEFVVGPCNRVALASVQSVLESPGQGPNPLVLFGPVGVGKTHLLEGLAGALRQQLREARVLLLTAEEFTNRFVHSMRLGKLGAFRKQFREADAFLVDDIHFLAKKLATQEEFLHTLDALVRDGRQVVFTCDGHPPLAENFLPELTDRLLGGAVWGVQAPDPETRRHLLRAKALRHHRLTLPDDVVEFLADELRGNVRELEGALHSVFHLARVTERPVTIDLVRAALADVLRHSVRVLQLADIERAVCGALGLAGNALQSKQRGYLVSHPRMLAMYLARKHTGATFSEIGLRLGGRNHSTAIAADKKVRRWLQTNANLQLGERQLRVRDLLERIERELLR